MGVCTQDIAISLHTRGSDNLCIFHSSLSDFCSAPSSLSNSKSSLLVRDQFLFVNFPLLFVVHKICHNDFARICVWYGLGHDGFFVFFAKLWRRRPKVLSYTVFGCASTVLSYEL
jgi:hypothetical protein